MGVERKLVHRYERDKEHVKRGFIYLFMSRQLKEGTIGLGF